jgi:hypothetical protein
MTSRATLIAAAALLGGSGCGSSAAGTACDGACSDATDAGDAEDLAPFEALPWDAAVHPNYVFVTSQRYPTDFASLEVVDGYCNAAAHAAGLPGRYVAWLSSGTVDAKDRLGGARGWIRPDGQVFADTVDDIAMARIVSPPFLDEHGREIHTPTSDPVLTATDGTGRRVGGACDDWKSRTEAMPTETTAGAGITAATSGYWTAGTSAGCGWALARFYCFGVDGNAPVAPVRTEGKIAFLSVGFFQPQPQMGVAGADALCNAEAAAAGLAGSYLALLATSSASAASRFSDLDDATWIRIDGVRLNRPGESLFDPGSLVAPLNLDSSGAYGAVPGTTIGARSTRELATAETSCSDWQSNVDGETYLGTADPSLLDAWLSADNGPYGCLNVNVICLEH